MKDLKGVLSKVAPVLASALGGPLAGTAVQAIQDAFGLSPVGSAQDKQKAIVEAVSSATPDQLLALKKADQDYAVQMEELGLKKEELAGTDRASARKRETDVKDKTPRNLAYLITTGFFGVLVFLMLAKVPAESRDILNIMLGSLGTAWIATVTYYYGSNVSSIEKTKLLAASTPPAAQE